MSIDIHTLAGAYALDAVDDIERAAFDRHLAECDSCAQELAEFRATVARLTDLSATAPPPALKQAVLAEAGRTRQLAPGGRGSASRRRRGWRGWAAGIAAAAVLVVGGGAIGYAVAGGSGTTPAPVSSAQATNAAISKIVAAPDSTVHTVKMAGGSSVRVWVAPSLNEGVAVLTDMPKIGADKSYQLWLVHGTTPVSAGAMPGGGTAGVQLLQNVRGAAEFGVSVEKAGGSATPHAMVASFAI